MEEWTINDVPSSVLVSIFRHLDNPQDLANSSCVNRAWRDACDESAWETAFKVRAVALGLPCTISSHRRRCAAWASVPGSPSAHSARLQGAPCQLWSMIQRHSRCAHACVAHDVRYSNANSNTSPRTPTLPQPSSSSPGSVLVRMTLCTSWTPVRLPLLSPYCHHSR